MALIKAKDIHPTPINDKRALVKFAGAGREAKEVIIGPGSTYGDLLSFLNLYGDDYYISKDGSPSTALKKNQVIYPYIEDGETLYVTANVDAGIFL